MQEDPDGLVRLDLGGWISGPCLSPEQMAIPSRHDHGDFSSWQPRRPESEIPAWPRRRWRFWRRHD